jgi:hypothetical protein
MVRRKSLAKPGFAAVAGGPAHGGNAPLGPGL